ncbi:MAG TPA: ISNCY family transposase [Ktedonobacteraceae bacterium]|nr:ISNCY family transposase [Ktedonobacteraceae bacterium]
MNSQELKRITILDRLMDATITVSRAAELLGCSQRHVYRLKARYRAQGAQVVIHGNRGKRSPRRLAEQMRQRVCDLAAGRYAGCNQHHLRDLLEEQEELVLSRASVRRILQEAGLLVVHPRRSPKHRRRRPRRGREGELIQIDGSLHDWLQERGPRLALVAGIDDATGKVVGAIFREHEDQQGYLLILRQVVERYGCPQAVYHDRQTMFPAARHDATQTESVQEQLAGTRTSTQLGRVFEQLAITSIAARSPQAKGRIERLWGTFQDRLVSELRLAGARTMEQANAVLIEYLPRFNARFAVPADDPAVAWQPVPTGLNLDECFCLHETRTVGLDNTITYHGQRVQLLPTGQRRSFARATVVVHEHFDGHLSVFWQDHALPTRLAPRDPVHLRGSLADTAPQTGSQPPPTVVKPKADHPWRRRTLPASPS